MKLRWRRGVFETDYGNALDFDEDCTESEHGDIGDLINAIPELLGIDPRYVAMINSTPATTELIVYVDENGELGSPQLRDGEPLLKRLTFNTYERITRLARQERANR